MARVIGPLHSSRASGTLAGSLAYSTQNGGAVVRKKATRTRARPLSDRFNSLRALMFNVAQKTVQSQNLGFWNSTFSIRDWLAQNNHPGRTPAHQLYALLDSEVGRTPRECYDQYNDIAPIFRDYEDFLFISDPFNYRRVRYADGFTFQPGVLQLCLTETLISAGYGDPYPTPPTPAFFQIYVRF